MDNITYTKDGSILYKSSFYYEYCKACGMVTLYFEGICQSWESRKDTTGGNKEDNERHILKNYSEYTDYDEVVWGECDG